jgi:hypothetical protein
MGGSEKCWRRSIAQPTMLYIDIQYNGIAYTSMFTDHIFIIIPILSSLTRYARRQWYFICQPSSMLL